MPTKSSTKMFDTRKLVTGAILTALVVVLQLMGSFIRFGPFSISLVLIPIVIGAATCGPIISAWLGFVFSVVVLFTDAGAFLAINPAGTVVTVILKGTLCGLAAGLTYTLVYKVIGKEKNRFFQILAVVLSAIVCPVVNTGIFLLGCVVFFFDTIKEWGLTSGFDNVLTYMIVGFVGINFLLELVINIVLSPGVVSLLNIRKKTN